MEQTIDKAGRIVRSRAAATVVTERAEQALGPLVRAITVERQEWSVGGGIHLAGTWRATDMPVLIKLGVNANQLYWTQQMAAAAPDLVPVLYASGDELGGLPIGWTVMERVAFDALGPAWNGDEFDMLLDAAVRFQRATRTVEPRHTTTLDVTLFRRWLQVGLPAAPPGPVEIIMDRLERDWAWVASACAFEICHGDVHMCNVLTRTPPHIVAMRC